MHTEPGVSSLDSRIEPFGRLTWCDARRASPGCSFTHQVLAAGAPAEDDDVNLDANAIDRFACSCRGLVARGRTRPECEHRDISARSRLRSAVWSGLSVPAGRLDRFTH